MTTVSSGSAIKAACDRIVTRLGGRMPALAGLAAAFERLGVSRIEEYADYAPGGASGMKALYEGVVRVGQGDDRNGTPPLAYAFGAVLVEVRIHAHTCEIRAPRMTGAFAGGRIINPRTARSQYLGAMIFGLSGALLEATELDAHSARYLNTNFGDYLIPVNADVPTVDIIMVPEVDSAISPTGAKGIGELGNVGMAAAIANAVYHATGKRIRDLPITIDKLF